ncbi:MAG TPA: MlaD family protein [Aggregatilineales bacterium]|nr:MlaD family protein [Aggregatilineales bacterium]
MKTSNPTALGLFLVIGLALSVAGVLIFSSGNLFHHQQKSILYFDGSLKGLNPGAPVKFRGVTIGKVDQVLIRHNQARDDYAMPVIVAVDKKLVQSKSDETLQIGSQAHMNENIRRGLRGRLDAESFVTGVLYVSLDIVPEAPPAVFHQLKPEYMEIPTIPSQVQRLLDHLEQLDLPGISAKLTALLARLDTSLGQLDIPQINAGVTNLLGAANQLLTTPDLTNSVASLRRTLNRAEALLARIDGRVDPLADNLTNTLFEAQKTLAEVRRSAQHLSELLGPDNSFGSDLTQALQQLGNAGRAVADLAEYLQRNPNALVEGRKKPKE